MDRGLSVNELKEALQQVESEAAFAQSYEAKVNRLLPFAADKVFPVGIGTVAVGFSLASASIAFTVNGYNLFFSLALLILGFLVGYGGVKLTLLGLKLRAVAAKSKKFLEFADEFRRDLEREIHARRD